MDTVYDALATLASALYGCSPTISTAFSGCLGIQATSLVPRSLQVNNTLYHIKGQLGEGGFSHVFLGQASGSIDQVAIKRMICQRGTDALAQARRELAAYKTFRHKNIISLIDYSIERQADRSTVYMVFPLYARGTLADIVALNQEMRVQMSEQEVVRIFAGVCEAVQYLHNYRADPDDAGAGAGVDVVDGQSHGAAVDLEGAAITRSPTAHTSGSKQSDDDTPSAEGLQQPSTGYAPIQSSTQSAEPVEPLDLNELSLPKKHNSGYVHRDIKLANVMLSDDGRTPVLMDFGSTAVARFTADTRSQALQIQDAAAEHCSMAYRPPELFDVQRGMQFDERTDVWALGCLLFALAFGFTPFEDPAAGPGASIMLAASNGRWRVPESSTYSDRLGNLVAYMLVPDIKERPFVDQVISYAKGLYSKELQS
ncbi:Serine/threonine-protein kinase env7 [Coemansia sp. Benny D115]|nr:Serine/threonine-protein kinase env7 [Coemansia sp. Benny D115]